MRRASIVIPVVLAIACSAPALDVEEVLTDHLPERVVRTQGDRVTVTLDIDDIGLVDELHFALVELGFDESTVYTMFIGDGSGTTSTDGLVAQWEVRAYDVRLEIEPG